MMHCTAPFEISGDLKHKREKEKKKNRKILCVIRSTLSLHTDMVNRIQVSQSLLYTSVEEGLRVCIFLNPTLL